MPISLINSRKVNGATVSYGKKDIIRKRLAKDRATASADKASASVKKKRITKQDVLAKLAKLRNNQT